MKATVQSIQIMVYSVRIISELYTEDWCFHYVGESIESENKSYLIISIHPHHLLEETSTREPAQVMSGICD